MNQGCLNLLWYFPYFGFMSAFIYAIWGVIACCTIILIPLGLGYFQIAKFLLSPFTKQMVNSKDLILLDLNGKRKKSGLGAVASLIARILVFPFGIIAVCCAFCSMIVCFITIIGIPVGMVYWKLLPTLFNPIGKVCVPRAIADKINRLKTGNYLPEDAPEVANLERILAIQKEEEEREKAEQERMMKQLQEIRIRIVTWLKKWGWLVGSILLAIIVTVSVVCYIQTQKENAKRIETARTEFNEVYTEAKQIVEKANNYLEDVQYVFLKLPALVNGRDVVTNEFNILYSEVENIIKSNKKILKCKDVILNEDVEADVAEWTLADAKSSLKELKRYDTPLDYKYNSAKSQIFTSADEPYNDNWGANQEEANKYFDLGYKCHVNNDFDSAVNYYKQAVRLGHAAAMNNLGICYDNGYGGLEKNEVLAYVLYRSAASGNNVTGMNNVAECYEYGKGTEVDLETAKWYYKRAAWYGNSSAKAACKRLGISW